MSEPFDLARTVRALGVGQVDQGRWMWSTRIGDDVCTILVEPTPTGVVGRAWGSVATEILDRMPTYLGADDVTGLAVQDDPVRRILHDARGLRLGRTLDVHGALVKGVLGQVVTRTEANRSMRALTAALGDPAPGPSEGLRSVPSPQTLASTPYEVLHGFGIERRRAEILVEVSRRNARLAEILDMDRASAMARLTAIRGIGSWTAAVVMGTAYGDKDAVPIGDYHMPNTIGFVLAGEDRATDQRMVDLLEPYRPERRRVVVAIKQAGLHAPRYGPRTAVREHL